MTLGDLFGLWSDLQNLNFGIKIYEEQVIVVLLFVY